MVEKQSWQIRLRGPLGQALEKFCAGPLAVMDFDKLLEPWRCKKGTVCGSDIFLWGQLLSCSIQALPYLEDPGDLDEKIRRSVAELMKLQEPDGAITAFPSHLQLQGVDMTRETLVKIERGIQHIYAGQLKAIRDELGTTYDELLKAE